MKKQLILVLALSLSLTHISMAQINKDENYRTGVKILDEISGKGAAKGLEEAFKEVSPDMANYIIGYGFGEIYNRKEC